jgi:hypothetical protein
MKNYHVAFKFMESPEKLSPGYNKIPLHMIFDIKMDFTLKARLVAGEHLTDPPSCLTYIYDVSRESIRIAFLVAAYVQNAYMQATSLEKYFAIARDELGDDKVKTALIVPALYGL